MGTLTDERTWQAELNDDLIFNDLQGWIGGQPYNLHFEGWMSGNSGARVALVRAKMERMQRDRILKLIAPPSGAEESKNAGEARLLSPKAFVDQHIVQTSEYSPIGPSGWWLNLQDVGGNDLDEWRQLVESTDHPQFGQFCAEIVKSVLVDWNDQYAPDPDVTTPAKYIRKAIGDHLTPDGGLTRFLTEAGPQVNRTEPMVTVPGRTAPLPNPLTLLDDNSEEVEIWLGNAHGDLHLRNVLVPTGGEPRPAEYKLIDLGRFGRRSPLARDPMKLVLSVSAEWLADLVPQTALRARLAEAIVTPDDVSASPALTGYRQVAAEVHRAATALALERSAGHRWRRQAQLVLVGVALRFAARYDDYQLQDRWWFFEVAALAMQAFRKVSGSRWAGRRPAASPVAAAEPQQAEGSPTDGDDDQPSARIFQWPLTATRSDELAAMLITDLLRGIRQLSGSATCDRLAYLAVDLRATAERAERLLADSDDAGAVRRELAVVQRRLDDLVERRMAKAVLPSLREAARELHRYADGRWTSAEG